MMTRTPDEIKKGLEYLSITNVAEKLERFKQGLPYMYAEEVAADALALIQQLEADNAQQARCIENMTDKLNAMNDEVAKLQAERDAAVKDLLIGPTCETCKYQDKGRNSSPCDACSELTFDHNGLQWQWRGVQKEDGNEAT